MKNLVDVVSGLILLGICGITAWSISSLPEPTDLDHFGPASFPQVLLVALVLCSFALIIKGFCVAATKSYMPEKNVRNKIFIFFLLFYAYILSITYLGDFFLNLEEPLFRSGGAFNISTALFLMLALPLLGRRNILQNVIVTAITTTCLYFMFAIFFQVLLP